MSKKLSYLPDPTVRKEALRESLILLSNKDICRKHKTTLRALERYVESYLEMLGGTQIWDVLDMLASIEYELSTRKKQRKHNELG